MDPTDGAKGGPDHTAEAERWKAALRDGDEAAFTALVTRHHDAMVRLAAAFVGERSIAEEVAQESWVAVLRGLDGFEGRASLRAWIFGIVVRRARTRAARESRLPLAPEPDDEPAVEPGRFLPADHPRWPGHWAVAPRPWSTSPEDHLARKRVLVGVRDAIAALPVAQRAVMTLRDVEGCTAREACEALGLSAANERVILHRARSRVRRAVERLMDEGGDDER